MRMVGARDAVVALLLFNSKSVEDRDKSLFAGVAVDSMDAIATAICWYSGNLDIVQAAGVAGGAGVLIALAKLGVWIK
jgi:fructose-1-phosphate kinase PfkB-like protein